jgi:antitoxin (DNA-binding transcriptional repressor) of toxin-antitoxin stability system
MGNDRSKCVNIVQLRDKTKDILDGTHFFGHHYAVTRYDVPVAQITPPPAETTGLARISVTDVRLGAREILEQVQDGQTFLVLRYNRVDAALCPVEKETFPVAAPTGNEDGAGVHPGKG